MEIWEGLHHTCYAEAGSVIIKRPSEKTGKKVDEQAEFKLQGLIISMFDYSYLWGKVLVRQSEKKWNVWIIIIIIIIKRKSTSLLWKGGGGIYFALHVHVVLQQCSCTWNLTWVGPATTISTALMVHTLVLVSTCIVLGTQLLDLDIRGRFH